MWRLQALVDNEMFTCFDPVITTLPTSEFIELNHKSQLND